MKCTKCGTEFSGNFCPKCGAGAEKKKLGCLKIGLIVLGIFVALIIFAAIVGSSSSSPASSSPSKTGSSPVSQTSQSSTTDPTSEPAPEYIEVTASELLAAYDENAVAADNQYKNQMLKVTGTVGTIGKDALDQAFVTLKNDDQYSLFSVMCYFSNDNLDGIASLKEGDTVTIIGKCTDGKLGVSMKKCDLVTE